MNALGRELRRIVGGRCVHGPSGQGEIRGELAEHVGREEALVVVRHVVVLGQRAHPAGGVLVLAREREELLGGRALPRVEARFEPLERGVEAKARLREQTLDLARQRERAVEQPPRACVAGVRLVVDEQHDAEVGVLLQGRGEQRHQDHARLLLVGGHERGDGRPAPGEELVDHRPRHPAVPFRPVVEAEPCEQIGRRRGREEADRGEEAGRLDDARVTGDAFEHLAVQDRDDERDPGRDREDHGGAAERHRPVARDPRDGRDRILVRVGAPLAADAVALLAANRDAHQCVSAPVLTAVGSPGNLKSGCHGMPGSAGSSSSGWSPCVYQRAW